MRVDPGKQTPGIIALVCWDRRIRNYVAVTGLANSEPIKGFQMTDGDNSRGRAFCPGVGQVQAVEIFNVLRSDHSE